MAIAKIAKLAKWRFLKFQNTDTPLIIINNLEILEDIYLASSDKVIFKVDSWDDVDLALNQSCLIGLLLSNNLLNHPDFKKIFIHTVES